LELKTRFENLETTLTDFTELNFEKIIKDSLEILSLTKKIHSTLENERTIFQSLQKIAVLLKTLSTTREKLIPEDQLEPIQQKLISNFQELKTLLF